MEINLFIKDFLKTRKDHEGKIVKGRYPEGT